MAAKTFKKAAATETVAAPVAEAKAEAQAERALNPLFVGQFKNITGKQSGKSFQAIEVAQDVTLTKGQLIVFTSLEDNLQFQIDKGYNDMTAEKAQGIIDKIGSWKLGEFSLMKPKA